MVDLYLNFLSLPLSDSFVLQKLDFFQLIHWLFIHSVINFFPVIKLTPKQVRNQGWANEGIASTPLTSKTNALLSPSPVPVSSSKNVSLPRKPLKEACYRPAPRLDNFIFDFKILILHINLLVLWLSLILFSDLNKFVGSVWLGGKSKIVLLEGN